MAQHNYCTSKVNSAGITKQFNSISDSKAFGRPNSLAPISPHNLALVQFMRPMKIHASHKDLCVPREFMRIQCI